MKHDIHGKIQHDYEFKFCKFSAGLDPDQIVRKEKKE